MNKTETLRTFKQIAIWLHERYEKHAHHEGWNTQESTKVAFDDLPEANRATMLLIGRDVQDLIRAEVKAALDAVELEEMTDTRHHPFILDGFHRAVAEQQEKRKMLRKLQEHLEEESLVQELAYYGVERIEE